MTLAARKREFAATLGVSLDQIEKLYQELGPAEFDVWFQKRQEVRTQLLEAQRELAASRVQAARTARNEMDAAARLRITQAAARTERPMFIGEDSYWADPIRSAPAPPDRGVRVEQPRVAIQARRRYFED